jgi:hypothetical protein
VSRAYISLEKPRLRANLRVFPGFLPVFWNAANPGNLQFLYVVVLQPIEHTMQGYDEDKRPVTRPPVTEVLETVRRYYVTGLTASFS